ncbi:hypothetical protein SXM_2760 [Shewanella xiamenensis]|nr:hypothetical protein SXM_2760 [Shewanella xiamenensis]
MFYRQLYQQAIQFFPLRLESLGVFDMRIGDRQKKLRTK